MKKILIGLSLIIGSKLFIKSTIITGTSLLITNNSYSQPSGITAQTVGSNNSYVFYKQNSPTNIHKSRFDIMYHSKDTLSFRVPHIYLDTIIKRNDGNIIGKLMWLGTNGEVLNSPLSNLTLSISNISNLQTQLNSFYLASNPSNYLSSVTYSNILGLPTLFSGSYIDLSNKPIIPTNNNELTNGSGYITGYTPTLGVSGNSIYIVSGNSVSIPAQPFSSITSKPTTLLGYGIIDSYPLTGNPSGFISNYTPTLIVNTNSLSAGGNTIVLPTYNQSLSVNGQSVSITSGNTITLNNPIIYYSTSGTVTPVTKVWRSIVTPTTSNGYTIDISSAGFSTITNIQIVASKNSSNAYQCPNSSIKSYTNSQLVVNIIEGNASTVNILGSLVLLGAANIFADVTGITLHVRVEGD